MFRNDGGMTADSKKTLSKAVNRFLSTQQAIEIAAAIENGNKPAVSGAAKSSTKKKAKKRPMLPVFFHYASGRKAVIKIRASIAKLAGLDIATLDVSVVDNPGGSNTPQVLTKREKGKTLKIGLIKKGGAGVTGGMSSRNPRARRASHGLRWLTIGVPGDASQMDIIYWIQRVWKDNPAYIKFGAMEGMLSPKVGQKIKADAARKMLEQDKKWANSATKEWG